MGTAPRWRSVVPALTLSLTACTINITLPPAAPGEERHSGQMSESRVEMFAAMMIPHHQQAIDMSELALSQSNSEAIVDLAGRIIDGQTPEIELMKGWLDGSSTRMGMVPGMAMGGMASPTELARLETLNGKEFDHEFLRLMIIHHEGALDMVHVIEDSDIDEVAQLARDIARVQTAEIAEMSDLMEAFDA